MHSAFTCSCTLCRLSATADYVNDCLLAEAPSGMLLASATCMLAEHSHSAQVKFQGYPELSHDDSSARCTNVCKGTKVTTSTNDAYCYVATVIAVASYLQNSTRDCGFRWHYCNNGKQRRVRMNLLLNHVVCEVNHWNQELRTDCPAQCIPCCNSNQ